MSLWHDTRMLNLVASVLFAFALCVLLGGSLLWVSHRPMFTLKTVDIEPAPGRALKHARTAQLRFAAQKVVQGSFFGIDLDEVRAGFEAVPWVRHAAVRRVWPDRLEIDIEEHKPLAVWGDSRLVNTFGEVFTASVQEAERDGPLPQFSGPEGSEGLVVRRYEEMRLWLSELGRVPELVTLSPRFAWTVVLDDDTTLLLGRDQGVPIEERVKRWAAAFPGVQARLDRKAELIDLRYPNGFAMRSVALLTDDKAKERPKAMGGGRGPVQAGKDEVSIARLIKRD